MPYKINDDCTGCGSCQASCPAEAILEKDGKFYIDSDLCIDCGSCVDSCPAAAIVEEN